MTPLLGFLTVLVLAFVGTHIIAPRLNQANPFVSGLIVSGIPYIILGLLLGPNIFNFLNKQVLFSLEPFISLALGWVGILFGIQLRGRNLRRFPQNYLLFTSVQSLIAFATIFILCLLTFLLFAPKALQNIWAASFILASLGCITAPITVARAVSTHKARGRLTHLVQFISSLDSFWGILTAGVVFAFYHPLISRWIQEGWQWLLLSTGIGIVIGLLFRYLLMGWFMQEEIFLLVLGLVIFTSGIGFYLRVSPIFLNMIVGIVLAQFRRESEKIMRVLGMAEKPIYLTLLIFAGALWHLSFSAEVLFVLIFILARHLGKYLGGWTASRCINCAFPVPGDVGNILTSFGGISLAIAFNYKLFYPGYTGNLVISAAIIGIIAFDEYAAWSTIRLLKKQGEIN